MPDPPAKIMPFITVSFLVLPNLCTHLLFTDSISFFLCRSHSYVFSYAFVSNYPSNQYFSRYFVYFLYPSSSRQVHSIKSVASFSAFLRRIFIRHTLRPLHQSVNLLSKPVFSLLFCQIFPFHLFCNNHTNVSIILIATCTMIYSFFMMSTRQNISNFRPLLNATQINAVISINVLLHKT